MSNGAGSQDPSRCSKANLLPVKDRPIRQHHRDSRPFLPPGKTGIFLFGVYSMANSPEQRANADKLRLLIDLRRKQKISQAQMAVRLGLSGSKSRDTVALWEKGTVIPLAYWRGRFLTYLLDDLKLRRYPDIFRDVWDILVAEWSWEPLRTEEWQRLFHTGANPYQGLKPFTEQDAAHFFGRGAWVAKLYTAVQTRPFLVVIGPSGSGKSSAVHAGLLPGLRQQHPSPLERGWAIITASPGSQPHLSLATAVIAAAYPHHSAEGREVEAGKLYRRWQTGQETPAQTLHNQKRLATAGRILILIDQFEELFNNCPDHALQEQFLADLIPAINEPDNRCCLLLILRADFLAEALSAPSLARPLNEQTAIYPLPLMSPEELTEAIVKPAQQQQMTFESGLVARILADVGNEPGKLTLLEFALEQLWAHPQNGNGRLTHRAYDDIGGVSGALNQHAEAIFTGLPPSEQKQAQRLLVQLARPNENGKTTRYPATYTELGAAQWQVAQKLAAPYARLVVIDEASEATAVTGGGKVETASGRTPREPVAELIHEALIDEWARYARWINEMRAFRLWQFELRARLSRWQASQQKSYFLSGRELVDAQAWRRKQPLDISQPEQAFIQSSQRHDFWRRGVLIAGLAMVLLLLLLFWGQRQRTQIETVNRVAAEAKAGQEAQNARLQLATLLTSQAQDLLPTQPRLGLLLAVEAVRRPLDAGDPRVGPAEETLRQGLSQIFGHGLAGHKGVLTGVTVDPTGHWLATASMDGDIRLWPMSAPNFTATVLLDYPFPVFDLAFSADGRWLAGVGSGSLVQLWDLQTPGQKTMTLTGHENMVGSVAFSPDGRWLATGSIDATARLWDLTAPEPTAVVLQGHTGSVNAVAFSPDNRWLATGSNDNTVRLWSVTAPDVTGATVVLPGHEQIVYDVAFSPDGRWLASASEDGTVRLWEVTAANPSPLVLDQQIGSLVDLAFSGDGRWLAAAGIQAVGLWDLSSPDLLTGGARLTADRIAVAVVAFSPDNRWLAAGGEDNIIRLWDLSGNAPPPDSLALRAHEDAVHTLAFSPDNHWLVSGSDDGMVHLWELPMLHPASPLQISGWPTGYLAITFSQADTGLQLIIGGADGRVALNSIYSPGFLDVPVLLPGQQAAINVVAASEDGRWLAAGDLNGRIHLWDRRAKAETAPLPLAAHGEAISALLISGDGRWLATSSLDGAVNLYALSTIQTNARPAATFHFDGPAHALATTPDSQWLIAAGHDPLLYVWPLNTATPLAEPTRFRGHTQSVTTLALSADGRRLISGSNDQTARVWDLTSFDPVFVLAGHERHLTAVDISADGRWAATASYDGDVRLWDLALPDPAMTPYQLAGHTGAVHQIAFSPDGHFLATAGVDQTIRLWDLQRWQGAPTAVTLPAGNGNIFSLSFSPDGRWLAAGGNDGTVHIWLAPLPALVELACQVAGRNLSVTEWAIYFSNQPYRPTCDLSGEQP